MRRILVPLDGSPLSETAIPYAKALAVETGCDLSLLSVWEVLPEELETVGEGHAHVLRDQGMRYFRTYLTNIAAALEDCFVSCEVRAGHPAFEIMLAAAELDADFVVMASHGRRGTAERRRGSVADKVLRGSTRARPGRRASDPAEPAHRTGWRPLPGAATGRQPRIGVSRRRGG